MTTQTDIDYTALDSMDDYYQRQADAAEVEYYRAHEAEIRRREEERGGDIYSRYVVTEREMQQADEDYIYVRDEVLAAVKRGVGYFDLEDGVEHIAHRVLRALQETEVLDSSLPPTKYLIEEISMSLKNFSDEPTDKDFEKIFWHFHNFGWVHA